MAKGRDPEWIQCGRCHGNRTVWRKCPTCNGRMTIGRNRHGEDIPCTQCVGGEVEDACGTCGGLGEVQV